MALKLEDKLEEDQGCASVLPAAEAKKQPQKPRDTPKESSKDGLERKKSSCRRRLTKVLGLPLVLVKEVLRQVSELDVWWTLRASTDYGCRAPIK